MIIGAKDMYARNAEQRHNNSRFERLQMAYPNLQFFFPDVKRAPWHMIARVPTASGTEEIVLSAWPHILKMHTEGEKVAVGYQQCMDLIDKVLDSASSPSRDPYDSLIEPYDSGERDDVPLSRWSGE